MVSDAKWIDFACDHSPSFAINVQDVFSTKLEEKVHEEKGMNAIVND